MDIQLELIYTTATTSKAFFTNLKFIELIMELEVASSSLKGGRHPIDVDTSRRHLSMRELNHPQLSQLHTTNGYEAHQCV